MRVNLLRVDVNEVNVAEPDPIDVEMEEPAGDDPNLFRGRTIQDFAALKLAKNILSYLGLGTEEKSKT